MELIQGEIDAGLLDARIEFVFSNRERGEAEGSDQYFDLVEGHGLPLVTLSSARFRREHGGGPMSEHRGPFHRAAMDLLEPFQPDICVLAGYMLIVSAETCHRFRMINLHPALPSGPAGTWQEVIWQLIEERAGESGVMVHVATEVVDAGPVLTYCSFPIRGGPFDPLWRSAQGRPTQELRAEGEEQPLFDRIRQDGLRRERPLLLETLRALAEGRMKVHEGEVLDAAGGPQTAVCLNEEVERFLRS